MRALDEDTRVSPSTSLLLNLSGHSCFGEFHLIYLLNLGKTQACDLSGRDSSTLTSCVSM